MKRVKIFGLVRYSILTDNSTRLAWIASRNISFHELKKSVFDADRLKFRLRLFEKITLPSVNANLRDWVDLRLLVITSEQLPGWHMKALKDACSAYNFVKILTVGLEKRAMHEMLNRYIEKEVEDNEVFFTFTLDDDDAVSKDFLDIIRPYLQNAYSGMALSLPLGYSGFFDRKKQHMTIYGESYSPMIALGLGLIADKYGKYRHVFDLFFLGSHYKTDRVVPVLLLSSKHAYFRTLHEYGDGYFGKNLLGAASRTSGKIRKPVALKEITTRINIDKSLFANESMIISSPLKRAFFKIIRVAGCIIQCFKK